MVKIQGRSFKLHCFSCFKHRLQRGAWKCDRFWFIHILSYRFNPIRSQLETVLDYWLVNVCMKECELIKGGHTFGILPVKDMRMQQPRMNGILFVFWGKTKRCLSVFIPLQKLKCFLWFWRRSFSVLGYLASSSVFHNSSLRNLTRNSTGAFILGLKNGWVMPILQLGFCSLHFFQSVAWLFYTPESFARYGSMVNRRRGSNRFEHVMPS